MKYTQQFQQSASDKSRFQQLIYVKLSPEANNLLARFQKTFIEPYIRKQGSLKGCNHSLYIMLPRYDGRLKLYRNFSREVYKEVDNYLSIQSQRRFQHQDFQNGLMVVRNFESQDFSICWRRVWHNAITCNDGSKHFYAQAEALRRGIEKYNFTFYAHDYNFRSENYDKMKVADPYLVSVYENILLKKIKAY